MILQNDKTRTNSNDKEIAENVNGILIEDNSELAQKINSLYPNFEMVLEDGKLIDVTEIPAPPKEPPEPNQDDYMLDLDYRLSLIELGL